jgi:hypothetical protein
LLKSSMPRVRAEVLTLSPRKTSPFRQLRAFRLGS